MKLDTGAISATPISDTIAERERRQQRLMRPAGQHVADRAGDRDRHAEAGRGRDRVVDRLAVERQHHVGDRAAADAHQRRREADAESRKPIIAGAAGQVVADPPAVAAEQQLERDDRRRSP